MKSFIFPIDSMSIFKLWKTIKIKSNILTGYNAKLIKKAIYKMLKSKKSWENPYGKFVSNKILKILIKEYKNEN